MDKKKKEILINRDDINITDGKIIFNNEELVNAIETEEFLIDGEEFNDGVKVGVVVEIG